MRNFVSYANNLYPIDNEYLYFYLDKKTFKLYDKVSHLFTLHDYLPAFLVRCNKYDVEQLLAADYVIFITIDKTIVPIKGIIER